MGGANGPQTNASRSKRRRSIGHALNGAETTARALFHCNYCAKDITNTIRVKCAVCPDFDLCLECFSVGVEIYPHKRTHAYRVVDNLSFPLFAPEWGADEELLLLEGVDMAGLGNWAAVAEHVGTKSQDACRQHYYGIYIDSPAFPEPMPAASMASVDKLQAGKDRLKARIGDAHLAASTAPETAPAASAAVGSALESGMASGVATALDAEHVDDAGTPPRPVKMQHEEGQEAVKAEAQGQQQQGAPASGKTRPGKSVPGGPAIKSEPMADTDGKGRGLDGHASAPHAEDGDRSDNEGAAAPGKMRRVSEQHDGESSQAPQKGQKRLPEEQVGQRGMPGDATLQQAAEVLATPKPAAQKGPSQRNKQGGGGQHAELSGYHAKRHEFEPEYDQDAELMVAELEVRESDSQAEREEKLRMVEYYNDRLTEREKRRDFLRARGLLNMKRMQGIERRRTPRDREFHAQLRPLAKYQSQPEHEILAEGLLLEARLRARLLELKEMRRAGVRTFAEAENYEADRKRRALEEGGARGDRAHARHQRSGRADEDDPSILAQASEQLTGGGSGQRYVSGSAGVTVSSQLANWRSRRGVGLDITAFPDMQALSAKERELCASARMLPAHYLAIKAAMLREAARRGVLPRSEARTMFRLDPSRALKVYDLLVACGWMAGGNTSGPSAAGHRADGQPMPGSAGIVKCDPLEGQWPPGFNTIGNLQSFPGFHPGPFQM